MLLLSLCQVLFQCPRRFSWPLKRRLVCLFRFFRHLFPCLVQFLLYLGAHLICQFPSFVSTRNKPVINSRPSNPVSDLVNDFFLVATRNNGYSNVPINQVVNQFGKIRVPLVRIDPTDNTVANSPVTKINGSKVPKILLLSLSNFFIPYSAKPNTG